MIFRPREWIAAEPRLRALGLAAPVLLLVAVFLFAGLRGVDFGDQWDEMEWHIQPVREMVAGGVLLPRSYIYPSLSKWLELLPALPSAAVAGLNTGGDPHSIQAAMKEAVNGPDYLLTVRRLFIVVSALAIIWTYAAVLALRRPWWEAFIAAACLGLTWEYSYHARWVANDCILTQFAALTLFALAMFHRRPRGVWLTVGAIAVGLGTGTKFPGVLLLVPVIGMGLTTRPLRPLAAPIERVFALCAIAFAAYLVTTPGTVLDPFKFLEDGRRISTAYQQGHFGYSVASAWQHWGVVLSYFATAYFSPFLLVSVLVFGAALAGAVFWIREDRRMAAVLVGFPLVFLIFFCGKYRVAIVRNYLFLTPFLGVLAARGIAAGVKRLPHVRLRAALAGILAIVAVVQAAWLIGAGESIRHFDSKVDVKDAVAYVADHPETRYRLSDRVRSMAAQQGVTLPANATDRADEQAVVFFARADGPGPRHWKTNDRWLTKAVFGPREINFNWYASWENRDRVLVMTVEKARATGVALAQ
ncbi:MAG TPA: glycosyltransferase family 39 protein [Polyangia bacterium]